MLGWVEGLCSLEEMSVEGCFFKSICKVSGWHVGLKSVGTITAELILPLLSVSCGAGGAGAGAWHDTG